MSLFETVQHLKTQPQHAMTSSSAQDAGAASSSSASGAVVSANAFLQLLVTELKNQDPTANQDPNAYVDQLVQVNSLQQLIQINQTLDGPTAASQPPSSAPS